MISEHPDPARGKRLSQVLNRVMATGKPVRAVTNESWEDRRQRKEVEALWLPLGTDGSIQRVIAVSILKIEGF